MVPEDTETIYYATTIVMWISIFVALILSCKSLYTFLLYILMRLNFPQECLYGWGHFLYINHSIQMQQHHLVPVFTYSILLENKYRTLQILWYWTEPHVSGNICPRPAHHNGHLILLIQIIWRPLDLSNITIALTESNRLRLNFIF